jgi:hypothetical protein
MGSPATLPAASAALPSTLTCADGGYVVAGGFHRQRPFLDLDVPRCLPGRDPGLAPLPQRSVAPPAAQPCSWFVGGDCAVYSLRASVPSQRPLGSVNRSWVLLDRWLLAAYASLHGRGD